jgi:hypothetical protein
MPLPRGGRRIRPFGNHETAADPTVNDDRDVGFSAGSRWINTSTETLFVCVDNTLGAAVWRVGVVVDDPGEFSRLVARARESPGEHMLGGLMDYAVDTGTAASIQYTRVWLVKDLVLDRMRAFQSAGGGLARSLNMGIYNQTTPTSPTGLPVSRLAQTGTVVTLAANNGSYLQPTLTAVFIVPTTGYYWLAHIADSASVKFAGTTTTFAAGYLPRREQAGVGTTLPAAAGALTNSSSSVIHVAALEQ